MTANDEFLDRLAAGAAPVVRAGGVPFAWRVGLGVLAAAIIVAATGLRSDLAAAVTTSMFLWKLLSMAAVAAAGLVLVHRAGRPGAPTGKIAKLPALTAAICLVLPFAAVALTAPERAMDIRPASGPFCVLFVTLAAAPVWFALLSWLRAAAPTNLPRASWAVGIASTAVAATLFVFHCQQDSIAYVALWYGGTIALVSAVTRLVLPPLIRW